MADKKKRRLFILTFCIGAVAVGFLSASLGTDYWLESFPIRNVTGDAEDSAKNLTDGDLNTKFKGYIHIGLFHGFKELDHGFGVRKGEIWMTEEDGNHGLFTFGYWVSTVIFIILSIALGLVAMVFSCINACTRPIETITGPMGLYLWNALAALFSLLAMAMYLVLFFTDFKYNVLSPDDRNIYLWTSQERTHLYFSFYFVVIATVLFIVNIIVVALSGAECRRTRFGANMNEKALDGVMMY